MGSTLPPILPLFNFNDFCHLCKYDKCHKKTVDSICESTVLHIL